MKTAGPAHRGSTHQLLDEDEHFLDHSAGRRRLRVAARSKNGYTDLPRDWLVTTCYALIHVAADDVDADKLITAKAPDVLVATVLSALLPQAARVLAGENTRGWNTAVNERP